MCYCCFSYNVDSICLCCCVCLRVCCLVVGLSFVLCCVVSDRCVSSVCVFICVCIYLVQMVHAICCVLFPSFLFIDCVPSYK